MGIDRELLQTVKRKKYIFGIYIHRSKILLRPFMEEKIEDQSSKIRKRSRVKNEREWAGLDT